MNEKISLSIIGLLSLDRLFIGSKSEGLYPVLHADDGNQYRLHYKGDISLNEKTLSNYAGKTVQVIGNVDNSRGHWRIVLADDSLPLVLGKTSIPSFLISEVTSEEVSDADSKAAPVESVGTALEVEKEVAREEPASKSNQPEE